MSDRAVATALDAVLCLLLLSAAVVTLVTAPTAPPVDGSPTDAHSVARLLAAGTATVTYANRTANGTYANLLADAAVRSRNSTNRSAAFVAAVRSAVESALQQATARTRVLASWRPGAGRPIGVSVSVGPAPPPGADVEAATFVVSLRGAARVHIVVRTWSS